MKKTIVLMIALIMAVSVMSGCGKKQEAPAGQTSEEPIANMVNPVVQSNPDEIMQKFGVQFTVPENAKDVVYQIVGDEFAEMRYTEDGTKFVARIMPAAEFTDIGGYYVDWTAEESGKVGYNDAVLKSYVNKDGDDVQLIMWFDIVPGVMYSLSAEASDLNGIDMEVHAMQVYVPLQGNAG